MGIRPFLIVLGNYRGSGQLQELYKNKGRKSLAELRQMTKGGSLSF